MSVSCDRCSEHSSRLDEYENIPECGGGFLVLCHACADECRDEK
jgi:hypothetical protein